MIVSPSRAGAYDALFRIETEKAFSSILLANLDASLSDVDRSLCRELVLGSLRRQIYLDRIIDALAKGKTLDIEVRIVLRLGIYQLLFLSRIPPYSAINESVNLAVRAKKRSAKGFVNAILRGLTRGLPKIASRDPTERLSVETSHPRWLIEKWIGDIGMAETASLAAANNMLPKPTFRDLDQDDVGVHGLIQEAKQSELVENCYIADRFTVRLVELAAAGKIYIQDEASQLVAGVIRAQHGSKILDLCAAPGGKTGILASNNGSARLLAAGDVHPGRINLLRENLTRQHTTNVSIVQYDARRSLPFADSAFDAVLVDAPCSGTGTIRHNPEIRYSLGHEDFPALAVKQLSILNNASKSLKPGGLLVYSTCSLEPEENESVRDRFLQLNGNFRVEQRNFPWPLLSDGGSLRIWPHRSGTDGFFITTFQRSADGA